MGFNKSLHNDILSASLSGTSTALLLITTSKEAIATPAVKIVITPCICPLLNTSRLCFFVKLATFVISSLKTRS
jgi:hypothetical protein